MIKRKNTAPKYIPHIQHMPGISATSIRRMQEKAGAEVRVGASKGNSARGEAGENSALGLNSSWRGV